MVLPVFGCAGKRRFGLAVCGSAWNRSRRKSCWDVGGWARACGSVVGRDRGRRAGIIREMNGTITGVASSRRKREKSRRGGRPCWGLLQRVDGQGGDGWREKNGAIGWALHPPVNAGTRKKDVQQAGAGLDDA